MEGGKVLVGALAQGPDQEAAVLGAAQGHGIDAAVGGGEAEVPGTIGGLRLVSELALLSHGGPLPGDPPGLGAVDGLPVDPHPGAQLLQEPPIRLRDGAVRLRADVQQQVPALAHGVHQGLDDLPAALILELGGVAPGVPGHGGVRLPQEGLGVRKAAPFHLGDAHAEGQGVVLVAHPHGGAVPDAQVVVEGQQLFEIGLEGLMLDPPVEVQEPGPVVHDELRGPGQPVIQKFGAGIGLGKEIVQGPLGHGRPVEVTLFQGLFHIAFYLLAVAQEEPVLRPVGGGAEKEPLPFGGCLQLAQHVPMGAHLGRVPRGELAFIHLEAVVMLRHGEHVPGPGLPEEPDPGRRVEALPREPGDEVLVAELIRGPVCFEMVLVGPHPGHVHLPGVPLVGEGGDAVDAPVDEDAQPPLPEPGGLRRLRQGRPVRAVGPLPDDLIHIGEYPFFRCHMACSPL